MTTETLRRPRHARAAAPVRHAGAPQPVHPVPVRLVAVAAAACAVVLAASAASGYLNGLVSGRGTATVAGPPSLAASVDTGSGDRSEQGPARLVPGGTVPVQVVVTNPYGRALVVTGVVPSGPATLVGSAPGCAPDVVTFSVPDLPTAPVLPGAAVSLTGQLAMTADAPPGCQGVGFRVPLTVEGRLT